VADDNINKWEMPRRGKAKKYLLNQRPFCKSSIIAKIDQQNEKSFARPPTQTQIACWMLQTTKAPNI